VVLKVMEELEVGYVGWPSVHTLPGIYYGLRHYLAEGISLVFLLPSFENQWRIFLLRKPNNQAHIEDSDRFESPESGHHSSPAQICAITAQTHLSAPHKTGPKC
jgi:hypothetical protein